MRFFGLYLLNTIFVPVLGVCTHWHTCCRCAGNSASHVLSVPNKFVQYVGCTSNTCPTFKDSVDIWFEQLAVEFGLKTNFPFFPLQRTPATGSCLTAKAEWAACSTSLSFQIQTWWKSSSEQRTASLGFCVCVQPGPRWFSVCQPWKLTLRVWKKTKCIPKLKLKSDMLRLLTRREVKSTEEEWWNEHLRFSEQKGLLKMESGVRRRVLRKKETLFSGMKRK